MELDSKIMEKAATLIEALPYIQRFNRKIIVVKYGGYCSRISRQIMYWRPARRRPSETL